tara:strand:+ start:10382 stop:10978 length:597 start_codon:yes stop_codon:yes gene_type:complete
MQRCKATTKAGTRLNNARENSRLCSKHKDKVDSTQAATAAVGAALGHIIAPGLGGLLFGGAVGLLTDKLRIEETVDNKRVFVSFDYDNDLALKNLIVGQAKLSDSPFSVVDCSLKEAAPMKTWEQKARVAIQGADLVLVMVGAETYRASGVLKEVAMARDEDVAVVQMIGRRGCEYTPVENAGRLYKWSWGNLKKLLS